MNPAKNKKLNPNKIKTRNYLMVALICGATKASVHRDERKEANKAACRNYKGEQ